MQPQKHNGENSNNDPRDGLDVAYHIIRSSEYSELLEQVNLGTGYYTDEDLAMQMRNLRKGLVADIAFSETLRKHAVQETKVLLAEEGFSFYDEQAEEVKHWAPVDDANVAEHGRTHALLERGEEIWDALANPRYSLSIEQAAALEEKTSLDPFKPIFNHLAAGYHESTKSRGARLMDNFFGRVKRHEMDGDTDQDAHSFLGRNGGKNS